MERIFDDVRLKHSVLCAPNSAVICQAVTIAACEFTWSLEALSISAAID